MHAPPFSNVYGGHGAAGLMQMGRNARPSIPAKVRSRLAKLLGARSVPGGQRPTQKGCPLGYECWLQHGRKVSRSRVLYP